MSNISIDRIDMDLVEQEVKSLKAYATPEELANLTLEKFDGSSPRYCFYGQMTGECNSKRAHELQKQCAPDSYESYNSTNGRNYTPLEDLADVFDDGMWCEEGEGYGKNEPLIIHIFAYLKGEVPELELQAIA